MKRTIPIFGSLVLALAGLGCSSKPASEARKAAPLDKVLGKAQILDEGGGALDRTLNAGGPSVYLWQGDHRYRLFMRTPVEIVHGNQYVAEGVEAQKAIDDIGDPDQGKNGYPLQTSCATVVTKAWGGLAFDEIDADAAALRERVQRYPARPVFLVVHIRPATEEEAKGASATPAEADANAPEVTVTAEKQNASLIEGPTVEQAPLWAPTGGTVRCKLVINPDGKVGQLETGAQLCESVAWSQFRYKPTLQAGKPAKVETEVEVKFEPRK